MTRFRAASSGAVIQSPANDGSKVLCLGGEQPLCEIDEQGALGAVDRLSFGARHDEGGDDALEHGDLGRHGTGHHDVRLIADQTR